MHYIGGIYRHPSGSVNEFLHNFDKTLSNISDCNIPCLIAGDLNINLMKYNADKQTGEYLNHSLICGIMPVVVMPTRITPHSATLIDHIYYFPGTAKHSYQIVSGNLLNDITDHLPNYLLKACKTKKSK